MGRDTCFELESLELLMLGFDCSILLLYGRFQLVYLFLLLVLGRCGMHLKLLQFGIFVILELVHILLDPFDVLLGLVLSCRSIFNSLLQLNNRIFHPLDFRNNLHVNPIPKRNRPSKQNCY
jgi:hypothetical protein